METFSALLAICAGNSSVSVNSPHKSQWRGALLFSLICVWINGWVNNREAGDLRRYRAHCDLHRNGLPSLSWSGSCPLQSFLEYVTINFFSPCAFFPGKSKLWLIFFAESYYLKAITMMVCHDTSSVWPSMMTSSNGNFSALLALCAGNSPVTGEFLAQRPVTRSFDVFFDLRLNKPLSKQPWGWWFETPSW